MSLSKLSDEHPHPVCMGVSARSSCLGVQHCVCCISVTSVKMALKLDQSLNLSLYPVQHSHPFVTFPNFLGSLVTDCIHKGPLSV